MIKHFIVSALLMGWCCQCNSYAAEPIVVYDLRYTNHLDVQNKASINRVWDHCHLVSAFQGLVNRSAPRLYIYYVDSQILPKNIDRYWLDLYRKEGQWLADRAIEPMESLSALLMRFRDSYNGLVVYDPNVTRPPAQWLRRSPGQMICCRCDMIFPMKSCRRKA